MNEINTEAPLELMGIFSSKSTRPDGFCKYRVDDVEYPYREMTQEMALGLFEYNGKDLLWKNNPTFFHYTMSNYLRGQNLIRHPVGRMRRGNGGRPIGRKFIWCGKAYRAQDIVFLMAYGEWPEPLKQEVRFLDGDLSNLSWDNIAPCAVNRELRVLKTPQDLAQVLCYDRFRTRGGLTWNVDIPSGFFPTEARYKKHMTMNAGEMVRPSVSNGNHTSMMFQGETYQLYEMAYALTIHEWPTTAGGIKYGYPMDDDDNFLGTKKPSDNDLTAWNALAAFKGNPRVDRNSEEWQAGRDAYLEQMRSTAANPKFRDFGCENPWL